MVSEARNLNKSYGREVSSFSSLSASDGNIAQYSNLGASVLAYSDASFQLDSGYSGDILGAEFWMREILPQNLSELQKMWMKSSSDSFIGIIFF